MKRKDNKGRTLRNNEYQRKDGRYGYQYYDVKGNRKYVYSWRLLETDAQPKDKPCDCLREMEKAIQKDTLNGIEARNKVTLNTRWDMYISNKPELKQSTRTNYKYMYDKYIRNDIGQMPIKDITYSIVKAFFTDKLHKAGFKPNSVETLHTITNPVFKTAVRDGLIRINPAETIMAELKRSDDWMKPQRHALTEEEQKALVSYVTNHPTFGHWRPLIVCLLGTGCRIAEMLGLRWCDISWTENTISINHNLIYRLQDDGTVQLKVTTTKTRSGNRIIPMFTAVRDALKEEYRRQEKEGFCITEVDGYSGFIWANRYHEVLKAHDVNRAFERIREHYNAEQKTKKEQLPYFTAHHLRHTFCVRLCEHETDIKLIQEIMGHASIQTTMDIYNESNTNRKKEHFALLEKMSAVF